jgi:hypothetical protein
MMLFRHSTKARTSLELPQPAFLFPPKFPPITYHQRELLYKLVRLTKEEASYLANSGGDQIQTNRT